MLLQSFTVVPARKVFNLLLFSPGYIYRCFSAVKSVDYVSFFSGLMESVVDRLDGNRLIFLSIYDLLY